MPKILLVDDDPQALDSMRRLLEIAGHEVVCARDGQEALERARPQGDGRREIFDAVVSDVRMPRLGGLEFLRALNVFADGTPVILMTAFGRIEDAVWAMKLGAVDFLAKPFKRQTLLDSLENALARSRARVSARPSASSLGAVSPSSATGLLRGGSVAMQALRAMIARAAPTQATVLIQGESGTGKELVARCLHAQSARHSGPFVALNCAALPENLIESELFGYEKGAFTGATSARAGLFEAASGGTLLLDEIGDMHLSLQSRLLRVLQEGEVRRLGATASRPIDVRVIAATHQDLRENVSRGTFRQDLLFRLEVIGLKVPPLRERSGDIDELSDHFVAESARRHGKDVRKISPEARACLGSHAWPGNVRELANVIERAVVFAQGDQLELADLPEHLVGMTTAPDTAGRAAGAISIPIGTSLREVEDLLIRRTLEATSGDKNMTARLLGINSRTIYRKLAEKGEASDPGSPEPAPSGS